MTEAKGFASWMRIWFNDATEVATVANPIESRHKWRLFPSMERFGGTLFIVNFWILPLEGTSWHWSDIGH